MKHRFLRESSPKPEEITDNDGCLSIAWAASIFFGGLIAVAIITWK